MVRSFAIASVAVAAAVFQGAEAHTNMAAPAVKWPEGFYNGNSPFARLDSTTIAGAGSDIPANEGVKKIAAQMGTSTLRDFISKNAKITLEGATMECGKTLLTGTPVPVPAEIDFPWGHPGPCEAWCDNTKIFFNADCAGNSVGKIKVDQSKCTGAKKLQVMYAGVHVSNYEIYSNCVPLAGGAGGAAPAPATPAAGGSTPASPPASPATPPAADEYDAPATTKPSTPSVTTKPSTPAATPAPAAPKPATPAVTKTNCKRRLRN